MVDRTKLEQKLQKLSELPKEEQAKAIKTLFTRDELDSLRQNAQQSGVQKCIFCAIAKHNVPAKIVYDDTNFTAFLDINPANPGHILVIPKEHYEVLPQLPDALLNAYMKLLKILSAAVFEATNAQGSNIIQNNGVVAGQAVPHIHFHIIPRFENDGIKVDWTAKKVTEKQLENIQQRIITTAQKVIGGEPVSQQVKHTESKTFSPPDTPKPAKKQKLIKVKKRRP